MITRRLIIKFTSTINEDFFALRWFGFDSHVDLVWVALSFLQFSLYVKKELEF